MAQHTLDPAGTTRRVRRAPGSTPAAPSPDVARAPAPCARGPC